MIVCVEFNAYNAALFDIQARSLNNLVYWIAQIIGSVFIGFILDRQAIRRRARAFAGWAILFTVVFAVHIWAYFYQRFVASSSQIFELIHSSIRNYTRASVPPDAHKMGIHDHGYVARIWLYFFFGVLDAMWQTTAYWIIGAMSNDPAKLAYFSGLCMFFVLVFMDCS